MLKLALILIPVAGAEGGARHGDHASGWIARLGSDSKVKNALNRENDGVADSGKGSELPETRRSASMRALFVKGEGVNL